MSEVENEDTSGARLAHSIEEFPPTDPENEQEIEGWLNKFVVVSEWMDKDGNRYLVRRAANGMGENVAPWDVKGLLFDALYGEF